MQNTNKFYNQEQLAESKVKTLKLNLDIINKIMFLMIIALFLYYIVCANNLTTKGFKLKELKSSFNNLTEQNQKLELEAASLSSYNKLSERVNNLKMVAVGKIEYIQAGTSLVAKK